VKGGSLKISILRGIYVSAGIYDESGG